MLRVLEPGRIGRPPSTRVRGAGAAGPNAGRMRRKLDDVGSWRVVLLLLLLLLLLLEAILRFAISRQRNSLSAEGHGAHRGVSRYRRSRQAAFLFRSQCWGRGKGGRRVMMAKESENDGSTCQMQSCRQMDVPETHSPEKLS